MSYKNFCTLFCVISISTTCFAADQFCYRDYTATLICADSLEAVPVEYKDRVFFKADPTNNDSFSNSSSRKKGTYDLNNQYANPHNNLPSRLIPTNSAPIRQESFRDVPINSPEEVQGKDKYSIPPPALLPTSNLPPARTPLGQASAPQIIEERGRKSEVSSQEGIKNPKIEIFVAKWCPHCRALEEFLKSQNLKYVAYDVEENPYGQKVFAQEGGGIPISKINGTTIIGFDAQKFKALIEAQKPY